MISDLLTAKYGKIYADACRTESVNTLSDKLKHKMSVHSPPKILIERYLIEIAKNYNVEYTPDEQVMREEEGMCIFNNKYLLLPVTWFMLMFDLPYKF